MGSIPLSNRLSSDIPTDKSFLGECFEVFYCYELPLQLKFLWRAKPTFDLATPFAKQAFESEPVTIKSIDFEFKPFSIQLLAKFLQKFTPYLIIGRLTRDFAAKKNLFRFLMRK